jgi:hypothetical protein
LVLMCGGGGTGRRKGLKIPCPVRDVPVRFRPSAPRLLLSVIWFGRAVVRDQPPYSVPLLTAFHPAVPEALRHDPQVLQWINVALITGWRLRPSDSRPARKVRGMTISDLIRSLQEEPRNPAHKPISESSKKAGFNGSRARLPGCCQKTWAPILLEHAAA